MSIRSLAFRQSVGLSKRNHGDKHFQTFYLTYKMAAKINRHSYEQNYATVTNTLTYLLTYLLKEQNIQTSCSQYFALAIYR